MAKDNPQTQLDYLKERIKQNQELARIYSTMVIGLSVFVASGFIEFDFVKEITDINDSVQFWVLWVYFSIDIVLLYVLIVKIMHTNTLIERIRN